MARWVRGVGGRSRIAAVVVGLSLLVTGCWDITTPERLLVPTLLTIDWSHGQYEVTIQAVVPAQAKTGGRGGSSSGGVSSTWVLKGEGRSFRKALYQTGLDVPAPVTLTHLQVVVIGRETLKSHILSGIVDGLVRDPACTHTFLLLAADGTASQLARASNPLGLYPAQDLVEAEQAAASRGGVQAIRFNFWFPRFINAPYQASLLPVVTPFGVSRSNQGVFYRFPGEFVVVDGTLRGMLSAQQVELWTLTRTETRGEVTPHPLVTANVGGTEAVFAVNRHQSAVRWQDGQIRVAEKVNMSLVEVDHASRTNPPSPLAQLSSLLSRRLTQDTLALVHWSQRHRADLFDLGRQVTAQHPSWMRIHEAQWPAVYSQAPVHVQVDVTVSSFGVLH